MKKYMNSNKNLKLIAVRGTEHESFNVYLCVSGRRELLMSYRNNAPLYELLKCGANTAELRHRLPPVERGSRGKAVGNRLRDAVEELLFAAEDCMTAA